MNQKQIDGYIASVGTTCPHCGSENISVDTSFEVSANEAWRVVECNCCEKSWKEIFKLTTIEEA